MVVEIGSDLQRLQEQTSIFAGASLSAASHPPAGLHTNDGRLPISKLLDNTAPARPVAQAKSNSLIAAHAMFGAQ
jgi:hypothetical protein